MARTRASTNHKPMMKSSQSRAQSASRAAGPSRRQGAPSQINMSPQRCLPPQTVKFAGQTFKVSPILDALFIWMAERQQIHDRRTAGKPQPWTRDPILATHQFANVYRVFDRVSQFIIRNVIGRGDQSFQETCFRVILFRLFNRIQTWETLENYLGGTPSWGGFDFDSYQDALHDAIQSGDSLYGGVYIIPTSNLAIGERNYINSLLLVKLMMDQDLPGQLLRCEHLRDAFELIRLYPSMGDFTALQLLLDLNMSSYFHFDEHDWVICGPGAIAGLEKIFGPGVKSVQTEALSWLFKKQLEQWARLGLTPPSMHPRRALGVSLVDLEHSLCEFEKYCRVKYPEIRSKRTTVAPYKGNPAPLTKEIPAHWLEPRKQASQKTKKGPAIQGPNPEWLVSHIVAERTKGDGKKYLVRWEGWGPEDDTWEDETQLEGAPDVVSEWRKKVDGLERHIERLRSKPQLQAKKRKSLRSVH